MALFCRSRVGLVVLTSFAMIETSTDSLYPAEKSCRAGIRLARNAARFPAAPLAARNDSKVAAAARVSGLAFSRSVSDMAPDLIMVMFIAANVALLLRESANALSMAVA